MYSELVENMRVAKQGEQKCSFCGQGFSNVKNPQTSQQESAFLFHTISLHYSFNLEQDPLKSKAWIKEEYVCLL